MKTSALIPLALMTTCVALLAGPASAAQGTKVLRLEGVTPAVANQLKKKFPFLAGTSEPTLADIDELVRALYATGIYASVEAGYAPPDANSPSKDGKIIVIRTDYSRKIQDFTIEGNTEVKTSEIVKVLGLERNQTYDKKNLTSKALELQEYYKDLGYLAEIGFELNLTPSGDLALKVKITEGSQFQIKEIAVEGGSADLQKRLSRITEKFKNKRKTEETIEDLTRALSTYLSENRYKSARISAPTISYKGADVKLTFLIEDPWKFEFKFVGNDHFSDSTLEAWLDEEKLAAGNRYPGPEMAEKIRRKYLEAGFANIEIAHSEQIDESKFKYELKLDIKEGPRVKIGAIQVTGNLSRPEKYYANLIQSSSSDLVSKGFFNRRDLDEGAKKLIIELQNQGYFRARIQSQKVEFSEKRDSATVSFKIDEGPITQIRQIRLEGVESFPKAQILDLIKIKAGKALSLRDLEESLVILKTFYKSEGFLEMRITNEGEENRVVSYNEGNTQATVEFQIYEGPKVRVSSIALQGNDFTRDYVIMRELAFKTGEILTPEKIDDSIFRLQKLDLFSSVNIRTLEEGTNVSERTVIISVTESSPGLIVTRVGATNERNYLTLRGSASYNYRNLWGTGRGISLRADPKYSTDPRASYIEHSITASYQEPYILGGRFRGRVNLIRDQSIFQLDPLTQIQESNTLSFVVDRDLNRHIRLSYNAYSFSNQTLFERASYKIVKTMNVAKTGPSIGFDYRNDIANPSQGLHALIGVEYSDPAIGSSNDSLQTINFVKATAAMTHYHRLFGRRDFVFVNHLRGGYLANLSPDVKANAGVPAQEAFFLGGRSTLRGFNQGSDDETVPNRWDLFPNKQKNDPPNLRDFRVLSDSYFGLVKAEVWFPMWGIVGGTLFYDGGFVIINQSDVKQPLPYRDSVGMGLRVTTPVGPANIEIGWKLTRRTLRLAKDGGYDVKEAPWAIHISIGAI